jgi:formate hydrogenlyase transcriptional activator
VSPLLELAEPPAYLVGGLMGFSAAGARVAAVQPSPQTTSNMVGASDAFRDTQFRLAQVAPTNATVLLLGETGTGKGLAAQEIHRLSARCGARFVSVDCTSLPATLVESELFGRERGAFTDARASQIGRFELADGGTILLDEIGELPSESQAKLLRVLQEGQFERLGSPRTIKVDLRVIAATNRNLVEEVRAGRFRGDLFYRLNVFPITMPPLRERHVDIPLLVEHLVAELAERHKRVIDVIPTSLIDQLCTYEWPGNIRELENVLERSVITSSGRTLRLVEPLASQAYQTDVSEAHTALADVERAHIMRILQARGWTVEGRRGAAAALGLKPSTLRSRMRKFGIHRAPDQRFRRFAPEAEGPLRP